MRFDSFGRVTAISGGTTTISLEIGNITLRYRVTVITDPTSTPDPTPTPEPSAYAKDFSVSKIAQQTYDGSPKYPDVIVKYNGEALQEGRNYTLEYENNTKPGIGKCIITGTGKYGGTKTISFAIAPQKQYITYAKSTKTKTVTLKFKKRTGQSGVQICYSSNSKFKNPKYATTTKASKQISKLAKKKTYYFKVRSYKTVNGKKIYGKYSAIKKAKTK